MCLSTGNACIIAPTLSFPIIETHTYPSLLIPILQ